MAFYIVLVENEKLYRTKVEENSTTVIFGSGKKEIAVDGFCSEQVVVKVSRGQISVNTKKPFDFTMKDVKIGTFCMLDTTKKRKTLLGFFPERKEEWKFKPSYNSIVKVGRSESNNVSVPLGYVSKEHFIIKSEAGTLRVEDLGSSNGLFLNGEKIQKARLKSGDVLNIFDLQFELQNGEFTVKNGGKDVKIKLDVSAEEEDRGEHLLLKYHRSPRTRSVLPSEDVVLSPPPAKPQKFQKSKANFGHLISSGAMIGSSIAMGAVSPALLAARGASLVSPIIGMTNSSGSNKKRKKELEAQEEQRRVKYGAYIEDQRALIGEVATEQRNIILQENPSPSDCVEAVRHLSSNLWERMPSDSDFLCVRAGMGYEDLCVNIKARNNAGGFQMEEDEIEALTEQIIEENRIVDDVPFRLDLKTNQTVGVIGNRSEMIPFVQNLIISLTALHSFEDVKIVGIFDESERGAWESLRWLPHIWDDERENRYLAFGAREAKALCEGLRDVLKTRQENTESSGYSNKTVIPKPYYIFLCGSKEIIEQNEIIHLLLSNDSRLGTSSLFLFDEMYKLPTGCKYFVDLSDSYGPCGYNREEANKRKYFTPDSKTDSSVLDEFSRTMSAIELEGLAALSSLPNSVPFLEGFGVKKVEELNILTRWERNKAYKSMATPLGIGPGGKPMMLDMHEKVHGSHGLVAGTTGSGKSEMLLSWIMSMAVNYSPLDISFIIIDYKGGGLADRVEKIPHFAGKITNIGSNIERYLQLLSSENYRRQRLLSENGINDIAEYQKKYHEGHLSEPLPILFIVADEFAELKRNKPEFLKKLVSIACVGRSLGIHMILATQKPGGIVDDQISSNTNLRLCMKVASVADSREMIKRPDAARIRQIGRGYIRVGEDLYFDIFQSLWTGAPYLANVSAENIVAENQVRIVEDNGYRNKTVATRHVAKKEEVIQLDVVTKEIVRVAEENGIVPPKGPMLPELPETIALSELIPTQEWSWMNIPIGMFDMPYRQKQGTQYLNIPECGHIGIFGAPGTGKTTLLKTIVASLCINNTPDDVNIYILDCGGWSMNVFSDMPHVGGVALDCEEEKFFKFESMILSEFESRKKTFMQNAVGSLSAYRESVSEDLPAIVIAIDNITPVFDLYPDLENTFNMISREGATYGIYLIFTATTSSAVKYKIMQNVTGAIAFDLNDRSEYSTLVGRIESENYPHNTGRAYIKNPPPIEFQAAMYMEGATEKERVQGLKTLIQRLNSEWKGHRPKPIPVMPEQVTKEAIRNVYERNCIIPFGFDWKTIEPACVDLSQNYSMLISGPIGSGKSRLLFDISDNILLKYPNTKMYVFDSNQGSLSKLKDRAYRYCTSKDDAGITSMIGDIVGLLNSRKQELKAAKEESGDAFDETAFVNRFEMICIVIDDLKEFLDDISDSNLATVERICRIAKSLGVIVLSAGRMADVSKYCGMFELAKIITDNQNGIVLTATPAQITFFNNNLKYNEKDIEPGEGNAYLFLQGKCTLVKLMQ